MNLTVLNDCHLGAIRTGGTTPESAYQLRQYLMKEFSTLLDTVETDLLINGDLLDSKSIPYPDLLAAINALEWWLIHQDKKLFLSAGNHDLSKNSTEMSSFQLLGAILSARYPTQVKVIYSLTEIYPGYWVLPHIVNQDRFNAALEKVPECKFLFVHANYDNNFAMEADHSLNMSKEQAEACKAKTIIFGHEHDRKVALDGKVQITGNQIASSVMDCLHGGTKKYAVIMNDELSIAEQQPTPYAELDWQQLDTPTDAKFIRIAGRATPEEASVAMTAIAKYRNRSDAFVVTNAVQVLTDEGGLALIVSLEDIQSFDILGALKEILTSEEIAAIDGLPQ